MDYADEIRFATERVDGSSRAHVRRLAEAKAPTSGPDRPGLTAGAAAVDRAPPRDQTRRAVAGERRGTAAALSADEVADLALAAGRIGVHGNRYNDYHLGLAGR